MKKIAMLFPYAPAYREGIYRHMDDMFEIDWFFCGNAQRPLKMLDYSTLKNCDLSLKEEQTIGPFSKYAGLQRLHLEKYDVLIIAGVYQNLSEWKIAIDYGKRRKKPDLFFWTHGWYGRESFLRKILKKIFYKCGTGLFVYGDRAKNLMVKEGFKPQSLHVIHNSLDYDKQFALRNQITHTDIYRNHFGNQHPVLIMIGRLNLRKKLGMLLEAVSILKAQGEHYNVVFIGDGEDRSALEKLSFELNIADNVWFYGACYDEKLNAELLYNSDMCVVPGDIGLTAMHCMMFGVPAISHNYLPTQGPEVEAIVEGKTGVLFEHDNVNSLAKCLSNWFAQNGKDRELVRQYCYQEIDTNWTPQFQIQVLKQALQID